MKWATRELIHFDRVVSAWLIARFIDPEAQFIFLSDGATVGEDVTPFGFSGAELAPHDNGITTFQCILDAYSIQDTGLFHFAKIVAEVVDHVVHDRTRSDVTARDPHTAGVLALAEGTMLLSATDGECLERSLPLYDALYARLQAQNAIEALAPSPPATVFEQSLQIASATNELRRMQSDFTSLTFVQALSAGVPS